MSLSYGIVPASRCALLARWVVELVSHATALKTGVNQISSDVEAITPRPPRCRQNGAYTSSTTAQAGKDRRLHGRRRRRMFEEKGLSSCSCSMVAPQHEQARTVSWKLVLAKTAVCVDADRNGSEAIKVVSCAITLIIRNCFRSSQFSVAAMVHRRVSHCYLRFALSTVLRAAERRWEHRISRRDVAYTMHQGPLLAFGSSSFGKPDALFCS